MTAPLDFEALFNASPYPYLAVAPDWTIIGANPAYLKSVKRGADIIGRQLFDAFPANALDPASTNDDIVRGSMQIAMDTGLPHTTALLRYAVPVQTEAGPAFEPRYWSTVHTPVKDAEGRVACVIQNAIDVTALYDAGASAHAPTLQENAIGGTADALQAQTHQALMRILDAERNHLLGLFNQAPGFIAVLRGPYHVFELVNEAYYQLLGQRDIVGKPLREALPDVMGQGFEELLDGVYASGRPFVGKGMRFEAQRVPGGPLVELYIDLLYQPFFDADGSVSGIFAQGQDVTEIYLANQALREADRRKDEFLAMLAHELRNPLSPIASTAALLPLVAADPQRVRDAAATIRKQVNHLTGLLDDLLDVSRVTSGLVTIARAPVDIAEVLADAEEQVRSSFAHREQRFTWTRPAQTVRVDGDHKRLVQVLTNLLGNAARYSGERSEISAAISETGAHVEVAVRDSGSGSGIDADFLPHVFDLFAQSKRSSARSDGGLGLGLSLVKSLVELHGGSVRAHSDGPGLGSRFVVSLPRASAPSRDTAATATATAGAPSTFAAARRFLVVDDNADAADVMAEYLRACGHAVETAYDAAGALALAQRAGFDVCLLDIGLPGDMDGKALARRLRGIDHTARALMVAVTGYGHAADRDQGMQAGFDHYLVKPVDLQQILALAASAP